MIKWLIHLLGGITKDEYAEEVCRAYIAGNDDIWIE